jgi:hypothetical protein
MAIKHTSLPDLRYQSIDLRTMSETTARLLPALVNPIHPVRFHCPACEASLHENDLTRVVEGCIRGQTLSCMVYHCGNCGTAYYRIALWEHLKHVKGVQHAR